MFPLPKTLSFNFHLNVHTQIHPVGTYFYSMVARWYIFKPKSQFMEILEGLGLEKVGIF
jgi:hypothetical protein